MPAQTLSSWKFTPRGPISTRLTAGKYASHQIVVVGRDGKIAFNADLVDDQTCMRIFYRAAQALGYIWPLDETGPKEQVEQQQMNLYEFLINEQINRARAKP
jgi:hypothetical protein